MKIEFIQNVQCKAFLRIGLSAQHFTGEVLDLKEGEETNAIIVADLVKSGNARRLPGYVKTNKKESDDAK